MAEPFSAAEQDGRVLQHEPMPAGGHDIGWQPSPSSPPLPKQFEYPLKLLIENGAASVHTRSTLLFGRLMVTPQPVTALCEAVPPGHSAESTRPPVLLFTVNV